MVGTPRTIADEMEEWLHGGGCDGFNIMFPYVPGGLDDFVDRVVPELQRRGLFRTEYEGRTLRENLGLPRPPNRFFAAARLNAAGDRPGQAKRIETVRCLLSNQRRRRRSGKSYSSRPSPRNATSDKV